MDTIFDWGAMLGIENWESYVERRSQNAGLFGDEINRGLFPVVVHADYILCDHHGRSLAIIEAKRFSVNPADAAELAGTTPVVQNSRIFLATC